LGKCIFEIEYKEINKRMKAQVKGLFKGGDEVVKNIDEVKIDKPYKRPNNATTKAQRKSTQ